MEELAELLPDEQAQRSSFWSRFSKKRSTSSGISMIASPSGSGPTSASAWGVGHDPALDNVRPAVSAVGGEQGGRVAHLRVRVLAEELGTHRYSLPLREIY
jgi:hypothetical protein